ncbi:hypothetical protein EZS27_030508 [termite gut metagenome]|uniref:Uncharacterized protein n=1 Tax=termite gut metagenome TaxID=433724 RepID=A0A5J4QGC6_9ZZZZ
MVFHLCYDCSCLYRKDNTFSDITTLLLTIAILILSFAIYNQRQTIGQYKRNDLKYRYIKMQGRASEENIHRLEAKFEYGDSVFAICKQVEEYERLVKEQAKKIERARRNANEAERLQREAESLKEKSEDEIN